VITKARRCLEWAHDTARPVVPGAEAMTNDQVCLLACDRASFCYAKCCVSLCVPAFHDIYLFKPFTGCSYYVVHAGASERVVCFVRGVNNYSQMNIHIV
jgi:hypothetical protein